MLQQSLMMQATRAAAKAAECAESLEKLATADKVPNELATTAAGLAEHARKLASDATALLTRAVTA